MTQSCTPQRLRNASLNFKSGEEMNISIQSISPEIINQRRMEIPWAALEVALKDLILDHNHPLQLGKILSCVHEVTEKRAESFLDKTSAEYIRAQYQLDSLSNLIEEINRARDANIQDRRAYLQSIISNMQVVA